MIAFVSFVALSCAFIVIATAELTLGVLLRIINRVTLMLFAVFFLAFLLAILVVICIPLTVMVISTYLFARFTVLVRTEGRAGISEWATETKGHFARDVGSKLKTDNNDSVTSVGKNPKPNDDAGPTPVPPNAPNAQH